MSTGFCRTRAIAILLLVTAAAGQRPLDHQPAVWRSKPDVPSFEKMENERLATAQRAIDRIVAVRGTRTIENTLAPYDEAIRQMNAALNLSILMQQVHPDVAFRDHATAMTTKVSGARTALSLNRDVYRAMSGLGVSRVDAATRYYILRQLLEFRLAGVDKDDVTREKLEKLHDQLTKEQSMFGRNISDDQKSVEVTDISELDGLPQDYIDNHKPNAGGKIHITTNYPDLFPALTYAKNDTLRRRLYEAFQSRAYPKNRDVLKDMMQTRYEIATLTGYSSWADLDAANKMIMNGKNIAGFIHDLDATTRTVAEREFAMLLAERRKADPGASEIPTYDMFRIPELVRRSKYDFDSQAVRPYLMYDRVRKGIMDTAATLFHVSFRQEMNAPAWEAAVETWEVIENGKIIGRFYLDMHPRPGKYSHAAEFPLLDGIRGKQLPEAALVCNFPEPTATDFGLMDYDDVVSFFHEFGHLMHQILGGQQQWAGISGISMERDFVEAPSQMLEEWMRSPQVLASFAHHYKTGEAIPADLVSRMNRASSFGRANDVALQTAFSAVSYDIYKENPQKVDLDAILRSDLRQYTLFSPVEADAHSYANFDHLAGYSSSYYTYMWDKVIAEDFFKQFDHNNLLAGYAPTRYRRLVLEPGGSMSANDLVKNFLGRPQNMTAFQQWMDEEFESAPQSKPSGTR